MMEVQVLSGVIKTERKNEMKGTYEVTLRIQTESDMEESDVQEMMEDMDFSPLCSAGHLIESFEVVKVE